MRVRFARVGLPLSLVAIVNAGCATMFSGTTQEVTIRPSPPDTRVTINNNKTFKGSSTVELKRGQSHTIKFEREGYQPKTVGLETGMNGVTWLNLLLLPAFWIGFLVDAVTGSISSIDPNEVSVNLKPLDGSQPPPPVVNNPPKKPAVAQKKPAPQKKQPKTMTPPPSPRTSQPMTHTMASGDQVNWVVAVMNVHMSGRKSLSKNMLLALTDQIRIFLAARRMKVVDRGAQEAALKSIVAEEKKKSYKACVDETCQIPLGKALAASHILKSSVARFGKACTTNGELIDLRREVTVAAGSARSNCSEEQLLDAAERLAEQLIVGSR